ncbi:MAG: PAS domain S-box protein [Candidatus Bathyarchaeia archaeon]
MKEPLSESSTAVLSDLIVKKPIRILHVDDDLSCLKVAQQCLGTQGEFQIEAASSVGKAIKRMKKEDFDVIVSDFKMPGKDGLEFLKELRERGNDVPFIIFTGKGREEVAIKALNLGADGYFSKSGAPETVYGELAHGIRQVAERKRAEEALKESETKYKSLIQNIPDLVYRARADWSTEIVANSKSVCGYTIQEFDSRRVNWLDIIHPDDKARVVKEGGIILEGPASITQEYRIVDKESGVRWVEDHKTSFFSKNGVFEGIDGIVFDVTSRKKMEQALHASLDRYRSFIEVTGELGWTTYRLRRHDGVYRYFIARSVPVLNEDGSIREWVGTCIDITERRIAERTLKESEEKYRSLVELAPDGILAVNAEGIVTSANRSFLTLVGHDSEEIVGKPFTELKTMRMEDIPKFQEMFKSLIKGESPAPVEFFYVRRDGTSRWAEVHPGLLTKEGNPVGVQVLMRDVSERKDAEKLILENQQRFAALFIGNPEATVYTDPSFHIIDANPRFASLFRYLPSEVKGKHLTDVVVPERLIAESKMLERKAAKGYATHDTVRKRKDGSLIPVSVSSAPIFIRDKLTGYISVYKDISEQTNAQKKLTMMNEKLQVVGGLTRHDVRNKLSAIVGNAYLARKRTADNIRVQEYLREIEKAVQQSVAIFDFAKTYEMLGIEELTHTDVEKTIKEAASLFSDLKGAKVINDCHGLNLLADSLLQQLFYNLIDNSLKYGQEITRIRIHYEKSGKNDVTLVYEDDGIGIRDAEKPKLFKEGYSTGASTGHGLYLIKKITEVYGWTIEETGKFGGGAQFVMTIPKTNSNGKENYRILTQ